MTSFFIKKQQDRLAEIDFRIEKLRKEYGPRTSQSAAYKALSQERDRIAAAIRKAGSERVG